MVWLTELGTNEEMEMLCVESLEETQTIEDYSHSAKIKVVRPSSLCTSEIIQGQRAG